MTHYENNHLSDKIRVLSSLKDVEHIADLLSTEDGYNLFKYNIIDNRSEDNPDEPKNKDNVKKEMVNHPKHYTQPHQTMETKDTIKEWLHDYSGYEAYCIGNVLKYINRAPYKEKKYEDLEKACFYLNEVINYREFN